MTAPLTDSDMDKLQERLRAQAKYLLESDGYHAAAIVHCSDDVYAAVAAITQLRAELMGPRNRCPQCDHLRLELGQPRSERDAALARAEALYRVIYLAARILRGEGFDDQADAYDAACRVLDAAMQEKK